MEKSASPGSRSFPCASSSKFSSLRFRSLLSSRAAQVIHSLTFRMIRVRPFRPATTMQEQPSTRATTTARRRRHHPERRARSQRNVLRTSVRIARTRRSKNARTTTSARRRNKSAPPSRAMRRTRIEKNLSRFVPKSRGRVPNEYNQRGHSALTREPLK